MIQVIAIGGEPATGKSTLVQHLIKGMRANQEPVAVKFKTVRALVFAEDKIIVLGVYGSDLPFPGTDRLSMAVQPDALEYLQRLRAEPDRNGFTVVFEGDRLFNSKFLDSIKSSNIPLYPLVLQASDETKKKRHWSRKDSQSPEFLKSRETKCVNIIQKNQECTVYWNENHSDIEKIVGVIQAIHSNFDFDLEVVLP